MAAIEYAMSADGTPIAYHVSGAGDPVLLVHGSATSSVEWLSVLPLMRERLTVVTMDRRGRGKSDDGPEYAMEREAEDVVAVLDAVDSELLVGHSYGALCSILAAERADRLRRLVVYEPPIAVKEHWATGMQELVAKGDLAVALEGFLRSAGAPDEQFDAIRSSPSWPAGLDSLPTLPRELHACAGWRHPRGPIDVPTLFLLGADTESQAYLAGLDALQGEFPNSRGELIPGQRHFAHVFAAEAFADLIFDFCAAD